MAEPVETRTPCPLSRVSLLLRPHLSSIQSEQCLPILQPLFPLVNGWLSGGNCLPPRRFTLGAAAPNVALRFEPRLPSDFTKQGGAQRRVPCTSLLQSETRRPNSRRHRAADIRQGHFPMRRRVGREMFTYPNRKVISSRHKDAATNEVKPG